MTIKDRKNHDNTQLKKKILAAALRIFAEQGYDKISMRKIAARIDYSPTTIYRFFRNKEELLTTIALETFKDLSAKVEKVQAKGADHPLVLLRTLVGEYIVFCAERPDMFRLFSDLASFEMEGGIMYERLGPLRQRVYQSWFQAIRRAIESGHLEVKDEVRVFLYVWDAVSGYIEHLVNHPRVPRKPLKKDSVEFLDLLFRGIESQKTSRKGDES